MKRYTAQEMRERAEIVEKAFLDIPTAAMLRQAADLQEREEREKKYEYEYGVKYKDGDVSILHDFYSKPVKHGVCESHRLVRREVSEWEEVDDVQQ